VASYERKLFAIDEKTGKVLWRKPLDGALAYASPVVVRGRLYLALKNGHIRVFKKRDGSDVADYELPGAISSTPAVTRSGYIYVGCEDGLLYAVDTFTGTVIWKFETKGPIHSSPAVVKDAVYIGSKDGRIYKLGR
jgi:outer membrane protein assembly factor BamB